MFVILVLSNCSEVEVETVTTSGGVTVVKSRKEEERRGRKKLGEEKV